MKITFVTTNPDENTGSYRIWIRDLCKTFKEISVDSEILDLRKTKTDDKRLKESDVIIMGKCCYRLLSQVKQINDNALFGVININSDYRDELIDFVIVGSLEEYTSLRSYDNVFIYPLIEREFEDVPLKKHEKNSNIRICYHGHYPHLSKFDPFIKNALEKLSKEIDITLVVVTGHPNFNWRIGRPSGVKIETHGYDLKNITKIINSCDIGIVPNVSDMKFYIPQIGEIEDIDRGWGKTDYIIRMKNKTNAGRSFVFYQHGIPVIHDLSPSSFEILGSTQEYCVAHVENSWEKEIRRLSNCHKERQRVSEVYYENFKEKYNPHKWAQKLYNQLEKITKE